MSGAQSIAMLLAVAIAGALLPLLGAAGTLRIALLANAEVSGDAIFLGSLLPSTASPALRSAAEEIFLGATPQQGTTRFLRGHNIAAALDRAGLSASRFEIPEVVTVQRAGRALESEEIAKAVRNAIAKFSLAPATEKTLRELRPKDFTWESAVRVAPGEAQLTVTGIFVDAAEGLARFRVHVAGENATLPFDVLARIAVARTPGSAKNGAIRETEVARAARPAHNVTSAGESADLPLLVAAGRFAQLHLHSENSSMLVDVKALQGGHLGETIRVRLPLNGKTLQARVVGERAVDATF